MSVLVCQGCRDRGPAAGFRHGNYFPFSSGGCRSKVLGGLVSSETRRRPPSPCVLTWSFLFVSVAQSFLPILTAVVSD